jgi:gamma-D-glutamyl-L-lysine dipeptidyl-peptidase
MNNTALCIVPVAPIRKEPRQEAEITSQLLFGEAVELISNHGEWVEVICTYDGYAGFCMRNQLTDVDATIAMQDQVPLVNTWSGVIFVNEAPMHVPLGSAVPGLQSGESVWGSYRIKSSSKLVMEGAYVYDEEGIRAVAFQFLNTAYLWGGRSVFGVDCSGFVQVVMRFFGKHLPRDAAHQSLLGEDVGFLTEARCGDLAFFDNEEGKIIHVGLLLNDREILHAAGRVRIDTIDTAGIINRDNFQRTHKLRVVKRL